MQSNMQAAVLAIAAFVVANLLFALALAYYRKRGGGVLARVDARLEKQLLRANFLKLCTFFAGAWIAGYIIYQHTGLGCEDLNEAAQCECYALEMVDHRKTKDKIHWAKNGLKMCPDSTYFSTFLKANPEAVLNK